MGLVTGMVVSAMEKVATTVIGYAAEAAAGHMGYKALTNIVDECADKGAQLAGKAGREVFKVAGKVVAGASLPAIQEEKQAVAGALRSVGVMALDASTKKDAEKSKKSNWVSTALNVAKFGTIIAGGIAAVACPPLVAGPAIIATATAAAASVPDVINAFREEIDPENKPSLVDDVLVPSVKKLAFAGVAGMVGNVVSFNTIETAYNGRIDQFADAGKVIGSYLPERVSPYVETIARAAGTVDAGRYAMSDTMVESAKNAGNFAKNAVQTGLEVGDNIIASSKKTDSWKDTAKRVGWLALGALVIPAAVALAPEAAAVAGAGVLFSQLGDGVLWARSKFIKPVAVQAEKKVDHSLSDVAEALKPKANLLEPAIINAPAA